MKIHIWIKKTEAISGNITKYYNIPPEGSDWEDYVEVSISQDEFARLEDNKSTKLTISELNDISMKQTDWLVDQYNRNREQKDWVQSREEIPYIFEKNPDTGRVYRRKFGDKHENREVVSMGVSERDYSVEKGLEQLEEEMKTKTGAEFMGWFHRLTKNEKTKLTNYYND